MKRYKVYIRYPAFDDVFLGVVIAKNHYGAILAVQNNFPVQGDLIFSYDGESDS